MPVFFYVYQQNEDCDKNDIRKDLSTLQTVNTLTGCEATLRILAGLN